MKILIGECGETGTDPLSFREIPKRNVLTKWTKGFFNDRGKKFHELTE